MRRNTVCLRERTRTCCCQGKGSRSGYESRGHSQCGQQLKRGKPDRDLLFDVICLLLSPSLEVVFLEQILVFILALNIAKIVVFIFAFRVSVYLLEPGIFESKYFQISSLNIEIRKQKTVEDTFLYIFYYMHFVLFGL